MCCLTTMESTQPCLCDVGTVFPLFVPQFLFLRRRMNSQLPLVPRAQEPDSYVLLDPVHSLCLGAWEQSSGGNSIPLVPGGPISPLSPARETDTLVGKFMWG